MAHLEADASPEKRLFIHLITRDIPLVAAFLDLIDNSINAAIEPISQDLQTAENYLSVFQNATILPSVNIDITLNQDTVTIVDNAAGISASIAEKHVFKFGRATGESHASDRLSVYGIGLKRAIFKLGNRIKIISDHVDGGFELDLDVAAWERDPAQPWKFDLTTRDPVSADRTGTTISVTELYDECIRRIGDGIFITQVKDAVSKTYAFYLAKYVNISINGLKIEGLTIEVGSNHTSDFFMVNDVSCAITAGIGVSDNGSFRDSTSGWFVFCNGRTVISADKSQLTGWATAPLGLPIFQPKHRPFVGTVFFVSQDAEKLPWTTTKATINEDSNVWQIAKRRMNTVGRVVISFLDSRYTDEGTDVPSADLKLAAGPSINVLSASVSTAKTFDPPPRPKPISTKISYDAKIADIERIKDYLGRTNMVGADVGRYTFNYFLQNEVGEE